MVKIFFKNFFRSLLTSLVIAIVGGIVSIIITLLAAFIGEITEAFEVTPTAILVITIIVAAVASFLWFAIASVSGEWFFSGEEDYVDKPPHAVVGILLLLLINVLIGGAAVYMMISGYERLITLIEAASQKQQFLNPYLLLFVLFPTVAVSQVMYFFAIMIHYGSWQICFKCGRMFCISYSYTGYHSSQKTKYKTKTRKEKIGSVSAGGVKIADVSANVTRGHYETTTADVTHYNGRCVRCGSGKKNSSFNTKVG